jgi:poly(3-hydroxyalkanoate) synthetase
MRIGETYNSSNNNSDTVINLKNINMPFLNSMAKKDDLVAPSSSKALNDALTESRDKSLIELNSGHVGLMIGKDAHKRTLAQSRGMGGKKIIIQLLQYLGPCATHTNI